MSRVLNREGAVVLNATVWHMVLNLCTATVIVKNIMTKQLILYWHRYKTRQHLRSLAPEQLEDIGITTEQAEAEIKTPFWR